MDAEALATSKIGGIPAPIIVGGVFGLILLYHRRSTASHSVAANVASNANADPYSTVGTGPGGWQYQSPSSIPLSTVSTNEGWAAQGETWAIQNGYDPLSVDNAVRSYIAGSTLDTSGSAIIAAILKQFGPLPYPLPPVSNQFSVSPSSIAQQTNPAVVVPVPTAPLQPVGWQPVPNNTIDPGNGVVNYSGNETPTVTAAPQVYPTTLTQSMVDWLKRNYYNYAYIGKEYPGGPTSISTSTPYNAGVV